MAKGVDSHGREDSGPGGDDPDDLASRIMSKRGECQRREDGQSSLEYRLAIHESPNTQSVYVLTATITEHCILIKFWSV